MLDTHIHRKTVCRECDDIMAQCRCAALDKTVTYETCDKCLTKQTLVSTSHGSGELLSKVEKGAVIAYTDMPFESLGDEPNQTAPIRQIELLAYDGDKMVTARSGTTLIELKASYVYVNMGRYGTVPQIALDALHELPKEHSYIEPDPLPDDEGMTIEWLDGWIEDAVGQFVYYNRQECEDLPLGEIEKAIEAGTITVDEIAESFKKHALEALS